MVSEGGQASKKGVRVSGVLEGSWRVSEGWELGGISEHWGQGIWTSESVQIYGESSKHIGAYKHIGVYGFLLSIHKQAS